MWVNCHICQGNGFVFSCNSNDTTKYNCIHCYRPYGITNYLRGQVWVIDNYDPVSPPSSPRCNI